MALRFSPFVPTKASAFDEETAQLESGEETCFSAKMLSVFVHVKPS